MKILIILLFPFACLGQGNVLHTINGGVRLADGAITQAQVQNLTTDLAALLPKTVTAGVGTCPTATGTQTITHNLGRTPTTIRIFGKGRFTSNAAATPTPSSDGIWCSSGNFCIYQTTAGTTTSNPLSSDVFAVFIATSSGNTISGIIQNVGATTFEIEWSETGASAALPFLWQAQ